MRSIIILGGCLLLAYTAGVTALTLDEEYGAPAGAAAGGGEIGGQPSLLLPGGPGAGQPTEQPATQAEADYRRGLEFLAKKQFTDAQAAFQKSLQQQPNLVKAKLGLAEVAFKQGDTATAGKWIQQALAQAGQDAHVQASWGRYSYLQKNFTEAEAAFKKAIALDPKLLQPRIDLGDLYMNALKDPKKAIEAYRGALAINPQNAGAHYALGVALATVGNYDEAQQELEKAGRLAPANPLPAFTRGQLYWAHRNPERALDSLALALKAQPQFFQANLARGDIYLALGKVEEALTEYDKALQIKPQLAVAHLKKGLVYQANNRLSDAEAAYREAIRLDPNQALAYNNLAWMAAERKDRLDDALAWANKAVGLAPDVSLYQDTLGWVYRARGEIDKAAATLQKASTLQPQSAEIFYHLGIVYSDQKKTQAALAALKKALELDKNFANAKQAQQQIDLLSRR